LNKTYTFRTPVWINYLCLLGITVTIGATIFQIFYLRDHSYIFNMLIIIFMIIIPVKNGGFHKETLAINFNGIIFKANNHIKGKITVDDIKGLFVGDTFITIICPDKIYKIEKRRLSPDDFDEIQTYFNQVKKDRIDV